MILLSAKVRLFFIFLFLPFIINGQAIELMTADMSSGDKKKNFTLIGHSVNEELCLLDDNGIIWSYNGYSMTKWNSNPLKNTSFFESIYLQDSVLFIATEDATLEYSRSFENPKKVLRPNSKRLAIRKGKHQNVLTDKSGATFKYYEGGIQWKDYNGDLILDSRISNLKSGIIDSWNTQWVLKNQKLYYLDFNRTLYQRSVLDNNGLKPERVDRINNATYIQYRDGLIRKSKKNVSIDFPLFGESISKILEDNLGRTWIISDEKIFIFNNNRWNSWMKKELKLIGKVVSIYQVEDIITIVTRDQGLIQARTAEQADDWIWISHPLNYRMKSYKIIDASYMDGVLFLFSEKKGVITLDRKVIGEISSPRSSWSIKKVIQKQNYFLILDSANHWYKLSSNNKKVRELFLLNLPSEITSKEAFVQDDVLYYKSNDQLISVDIKNEEWYSQDCSLPFANTWIEGQKIYEYKKDGLYTYFFESSNTVKKSPIAQSVRLETKSGKSFKVYPVNGEKIQLETNDFPIKFQVDAVYLKNPKKIEYAWIWNGGKNTDVDFSFSSERVLSKKYIGLINPVLLLTVGDDINKVDLASIETERSIEEVNNNWAIYLSLLLGGLLILGMLYYFYNNARQKRRISKLETQQKLTELEQKTLQLQMNPHFIFNSLNGVKGMIAMGEDKKARQYLTKVSTWMRGMLNDARSDKLLISQEIENLKLYMDIEQELRSNVWNYKIHVDENIDLGNLIPPMMIQPFVENAIVHAFKGIDYQGMIDLKFERKGRRIEVQIEDNGTGLIEQKKEHKSVALELIRERLHYLNEGTQLKAFEMINKSDLEANETGVLVKIILPIIE